MTQEFILILIGALCFVSVALQIFIIINTIKLMKIIRETEEKIDERIEELKEWMEEPFEIESERE